MPDRGVQMNQTKSISLVSRAPLAGRRRRRHVDGRAGWLRQPQPPAACTADQAQREQIVRTGTVTGVRPIVIQNDKSSGAGMLAGGALGGVAGNAVGGGTGRTIATVGGAIPGRAGGQCHRELGWQVVRLRNHGAPGQRRNPRRGPGSRCAHQRRPTRPGDQRAGPTRVTRCKSSSPEKSPRKRFSLARPRRKAAGTPRRRAGAAGAGFLAQSVVRRNAAHRDYPRNAVLLCFSAISAGSFMVIQRLKCHDSPATPTRAGMML